MRYLVLYADVFGEFTGTVDRLFDDHYEAELYCKAQNNATMRLGKPTIEHWVVVLPDDRGGTAAFADRVLHNDNID